MKIDELKSLASEINMGSALVGPEDIKDMAFDILRHRLILSYEAGAEGITTDHFIKELISRIAVP